MNLNLADINRGYICHRIKHDFRFVLPLQKRDDTKIFCQCSSCGQKSWIEFPSDTYKNILQDYDDGKIHD